MPITTRIIACLVGDPYRPSFPTGTGGGHTQAILENSMESSLVIKIGVSKHRGTPKSTLSMGFSITNYKPSILGVKSPIFGSTPKSTKMKKITSYQGYQVSFVT